jgi:hypothetical protein
VNIRMQLCSRAARMPMLIMQAPSGNRWHEKDLADFLEAHDLWMGDCVDVLVTP